ncbi:MDR family MFS transporter [Streptomyces sp. TP-A0874]|uniref:MDR family MFS transporter n=1 Tax=Streptomyces sp. TP-A0874 TaxID=549819 RepID=UPI00099F6217|nr:MDR family MFS transporter [Streptomyces sp. TP-A0874]
MPIKSSAPPLDRGLLVLAAVQMVGAFTALLDATIVSVALDSMSLEFDVPEGTIAWVSTAYLLTMALVTPLVGWGIERFGAKPMWMFALTTFLAGSVFCGLAWSIESLVASRVLQGVGGGLILPLNMAILARAAGPERFGRIMSLVGIPGQLAPILGPVLGGAVIDAWGWRWIFFINIPICLAALVLSGRVLPAGGELREAPLDKLGMLLLPPGLVALVYGFSRTAEAGGFGDSFTVLCLAAGGTLLVAFVFHALRASDPLIDLRLFSYRVFTASTVMTFLQGVAVYGPLLLLPLFYARVRGHGADAIGLLLVPQGLGTLLGITVAGWLADRYGARPLVLGSTLLTLAGTLAFTQLAAEPSDLVLSVSLLVRGFGVGLLGVAIATAAYRDIPPERIPGATSAISLVQRLGASCGTAVIALILAVQLADLPDGSGPAATAGAYGNTFWWAVGLTLVGFVPAAMLPRMRGRDEAVPTPDTDTDGSGESDHSDSRTG